MAEPKNGNENVRTIRDLAAELGRYITGPAGDAEISAIAADSRAVLPGALFVATRGAAIDSHDCIPEAVKNGAAVIIGERVEADTGDVPYIVVPNSKETLGMLAHAFAGWPARKLAVVGVTGTNGKTSTVQLCAAIFESAGRPCATIGTIGYQTGAKAHDAPQTTPGAIDIAALAKESVDAGRRALCIEVSSHALDQDRVAGIDFDVAVFTNLSQDHLDYHSDMDDYLSAKLRLFEMLNRSCDKGLPKGAVINADDPRCEEVAATCRVPVLRYGFAKEADVRAGDVDVTRGGTRFTVETPRGQTRVDMRLVGRHNVSNALAALAVAETFGIPVETAAEAIKDVVVPGRLESVSCGQPFVVVVDYAHTDDGLRNLLTACREIADGHRLIVVFGCGGDRDRTKRPKMGRVVGAMADFAVLTNDNPRTENPVTIALDTEVGIEQAGWHKNEQYLVILDRREAIAEAIERAEPGDVVAIAGKGHEPYQIVGAERLVFDDRVAAREILEQGNW
jgi:UDP-N-acetylmuramoyl-L-alanyl-D-glutamate--2,6-diaminopimelate ligase